MLGVIDQQRIGQIEHLEDTIVGDAIHNGSMTALGVEEAAPAQTGKVVRHLRLCLAQAGSEFADRELPLGPEQFEDADPKRVAEGSEVLRDDVARKR